MTHAELKALPNGEINDLIADFMPGWKRCPERAYCVRYLDDRPNEGIAMYPATDDNDMRLVRAEIERRGLTKEFCCELRSIAGIDAWSMLNATPRQQAEAALLAVQKEPTT